MEQKPKKTRKYAFLYLLVGILIAIILVAILAIVLMIYQNKTISLTNLADLFTANPLLLVYMLIFGLYSAVILGLLGYQRDRTEEFRRYAERLGQNQKQQVQQAQVGQSQLDKQHQTEVAQLNQQMTNQKTKFQELEAIIHRGKQQWEATFDAVDDLIILADEKGSILRCNRATGQTFMLGFSQIIGRGIDEFFATSPDSLLVMNPGEKKEMKLPKSDAWYQISKNHLLIDGKQEGWVYIFRNITAQKQAYRDQQRLTQYYELLVNNSPLAIVTLSQEDKVIDCNPAFESLFQYTKQEAIGAKIDELIIPAGLAFEANGLADAVRKGVKVQSITQRKKKDGTPLDVEIYGIPVILGGKQVGSLGLYHDISNLVHAPKAVPAPEVPAPETPAGEPAPEAMAEETSSVGEILGPAAGSAAVIAASKALAGEPVLEVTAEEPAPQVTAEGPVPEAEGEEPSSVVETGGPAAGADAGIAASEEPAGEPASEVTAEGPTPQADAGELSSEGETGGPAAGAAAIAASEAVAGEPAPVVAAEEPAPEAEAGEPAPEVTAEQPSPEGVAGEWAPEAMAEESAPEAVTGVPAPEAVGGEPSADALPEEAPAPANPEGDQPLSEPENETVEVTSAPAPLTPGAIPIEKIEGIGTIYTQKLQEVGINSSSELLDQGKSRKGREELVEKTGISSLLILKWVNMADLMRINGVGEEYSELLERTGVDSVKELRNRDPNNLLDAMAKENEKNNLVRKLPGLTDVESWVKEARESEPVLTY